MHRIATLAAIICFLLYALGVTWPGVLPFAGWQPSVLGLPFNFFWIILWIVLGGAALAAVEFTRRDGDA